MDIEQATCDICGRIGDLITDNGNAEINDEIIYKLPWGVNCGRFAPFESLLRLLGVSIIVIIIAAFITEYVGWY